MAHYKQKSLALALLALAGVYSFGAAETTSGTPSTAPTPMGSPQDYAAVHLDKLDRDDLAQYLGWVEDSSTGGICEGYYAEPNLYYVSPSQDPTKPKVHIASDYTEFSLTGQSVLHGNVVVSQPFKTISSDTAYINRDPISNKVSSVDAYGNVYLRQPGNLAVGDRGHFNLYDKSGYLNNVIYRESFNTDVKDQEIHALSVGDDNVKIMGTSAWGTATQFTQEPSGIIVIRDGTYTTCPPPEKIWSVKASTLRLNRDEGRGTATNARVYYKDAPVFYTPYLSFPIDDRRKTGLLLPTASHTSQSGYELEVPLYLNLAPNYDDTFTADYMQERGVQWKDMFRYLTNSGSGTFYGTFIGGDRKFNDFQQDQESEYFAENPTVTPSETPQTLQNLEDSSDNRYFVSYQDYHRLSPSWSSYLYLNHVNDDYYFQDFENNPAQVTSNQVINEGYVAYGSQHWNFKTDATVYQTLHPWNQSPIYNQYKKLPEVTLDGNYPNSIEGLSFTIDNQVDNFQLNANPSPTAPGDLAQTQATGQRYYTAPDISYPQYWAAGFIKPDVQLTATQYDLENTVPGQDSSISRVIPIYDIDSGLFFDRSTQFFGHPYKQTLEPRLFYLYVPYENQDDIPQFDTSVEPFTYSQLFRTNRYNGIDRIGDTNQISYSLTTRYVDDTTGDERLRLSAGQIYYFEDRRVNPDPNSLDIVTFYNSVPPDSKVSPIAGEAAYSINQLWSLNGDMAWNPDAGQMREASNSITGEDEEIQAPRGLNNASLDLQYHRDNTHIFNVGYTFLRGGDQLVNSDGTLTVAPDSNENNLHQIDLSSTWPLTEQWKGYGRWNYNISQGHEQNMLGGVEYDACCWAFRFLAGHEFDYLDAQDENHPKFNNTLYFQVALIGFGNINANNASGKLSNSIPGYQDAFGQPLSTVNIM